MLVMENGLKMIVSDWRSWFTRMKIFLPMTNVPKSNELKRKDESTLEDPTPRNFSRSELGTLQGVLRNKLKKANIYLVLAAGAKGEGSRRRVTRSVVENVEGVGTKRRGGVTMRGMRMRGMRNRGKSKRENQSPPSDSFFFNLSTSYEFAGRRLLVLFSAAALCSITSFSATLYCYALRTYPDGVIRDVNWGGADTSLQAEKALFPFLENYKYWVLNYSEVIYFPPSFSSQYDNPTPQFYVSSNNSKNISVPDEYTNSIPQIVTNLNLMFPKSTERISISSLSVSFDETGHPVIDANMYPEGTIMGSGVVTYDSEGNSIVSYPDSTGFVPGYFLSSDLTYQKCWYDVTTLSGNRATRLEDLPSNTVSALSYDPETGQYSFEAIDYSEALAAIRDSLEAIRQKEIETDLHVTVDSVPVTVTPDITVNPPAVNVEAPVVNVAAPVVNVPETVVNVAAPVVNVPETVVNVVAPGSNILSNISESLETTAVLSQVDTSLPDFDSDEQTIIEVYQGWNTAIPGISEGVNMGLDLILGPIPQLGQSLNAGHFDLGENFSFDLDFSDYSEYIRWFRAICLFALILSFVYILWNIIVQSFQI